MMDHRNERDNSDRDSDLPAQSDRSEPSPSAGDASTGSYYYDDSTGYEVYDDEGDCEEE
ncbi:MAG TPA: hypothetical protein VLN44_09205 [Pyrinomonadaceae bacterium]|nr:hypothetical protein [Pyrinomonadaceae bacterium]